jgi:DNA-binding SARP family transcriptional activator/tetratricopeptide (TPR) repeat protein
MEFKILGPLEVVDDGHRVDVGGAKQRALLAVLLLEANRVVSSDRLIDALWDESPPAQARKTLQVYVSQLRKAVGTDRIETRSPGYLVRVADDELDLHRVQQLASRGEFGHALALFRGRPLAEFESERFASLEIARLEELRLTCLEGRIEADLAAGRHGALVGELDPLVREQPLRERLRAQLMLALYRSGRQAEALQAFQDARRALVDELGIEPTRSLRDLHQAILRQDPELELEPGAVAIQEPSADVGPTPAPPIAEHRSERKTVTAVHVRVEVASGDRPSLDPELLRRVVTRAVELITAAVEAHEGTVEAVTGDAVTAIFGLPVVHEDDPARAAKAAEDARSRLVALGQELAQAASLGVHARIGVSTGTVMTGGPGAALLATGEPLTQAAALAHAAEPDGVLLDETTRRALSSRREGGRFTSPMVGRARERRRLHDAFDQAATDRSCQLFTILGAAGVGKSRLVQEFLRDVSGQALVARGRCLPYGEGITFWPVLEAVKDVAGVGETESVDDTVARVAALVEDESDVALRVMELIGLREGGAGLDEGFAAVRIFFDVLAADGPLVVVFDDVHWGEETFLDLVEHLADWSRGAALLLVCVARPELLEARPSWGGGKLNATSALLEPLSQDESAKLLANLVGEATLAEEVQQRIADAAEGNPLFVEEMLSMLIDEGVLVREDGRWSAVRDLATFPVPPTIQALLAARLDQLSSDERTALEAAAVEGKVFHASSVTELSGRHDHAAALASLVRKELVRPERRPVFAGERSYRFRHLMIRDAAYEAIPKETRARLHERHVAWLEERTGERSVEFDEIVGYHLEQAVRYRTELGGVADAELGRRAAEKLGAAGRRAFARSDAPAALNLVSRAVALLAPDDPLRVDLVPNVRVVQGMDDLGWADKVLTDAVEAAATSGDRRLAAHALVQRGLLRLFTAPDVTAQELLRSAEQAIKVFEELGDEHGLTRAWRLVAQAHYLDGQGAACAEASERALACARRVGDRFEEREIVEWLGIALILGSTEATEAESVCRRHLAEVTGDRILEINFVGTLAYLVAIQGKEQEFSSLMRRAEEIVSDSLEEWLWLVPVHFAWFAGVRAQPAAAEAALRPDYERLKRIGEKSHFSSITTVMAQAVYAQGRYDEAELLVDEAQSAARPNDVHSRIVMSSTKAKVLARRGDFEAAEPLARDAEAFARSTDFLHSHAEALVDLAEILRLAGRPAESADVLHEAVAVYEQKGNVVSTAQARAALDELIETDMRNSSRRA